MVSIRFDFCNVLAYFVLRKISREKSCYLIKIYLKYISKLWRMSKERNMTGNKIISLQEFLKKKKLLTINYVYPIEKNVYIPFKIIFFK